MRHLRALAERPGTPAEGETAKRLLAKLEAKSVAKSTVAAKPFQIEDFPRGTRVYYNYWAYPSNSACVVVGRDPQVIKGQTWLRLRFSHLKQPRRVPVTSDKGVHISTSPLSQREADYLIYPADDWNVSA